MNHVTAVIKAKDEAVHIQETVASARLLADEVIVVDDQSTDGTASLAAAAGAKVVPGEPHHGSIDLLDKQGYALVSSGWILRMDADERLTPALVEQLRRVIADTAGFAGARYARRCRMFGAPVGNGGWLRPQHVGLFRADSWEKTWDAGLHSQVPVVGRIATVEPRDGAWSDVYGYADVNQFAARSLMKYAARDAAERYGRGQRFRKRDIVWWPFLKMLGRILVRGGYRDGPRGWVLAALFAAYDISVRAHLWDFERLAHTPADVDLTEWKKQP